MYKSVPSVFLHGLYVNATVWEAGQGRLVTPCDSILYDVKEIVHCELT